MTHIIAMHHKGDAPGDYGDTEKRSRLWCQSSTAEAVASPISPRQSPRSPSARARLFMR
jgi:hypothetical protein